MVLLANTMRLGTAYAIAQILTGVQLGSMMAFAVLALGITLEASAIILPIGLVMVAIQTRWIDKLLVRFAKR